VRRRWPGCRTGCAIGSAADSAIHSASHGAGRGRRRWASRTRRARSPTHEHRLGPTALDPGGPVIPDRRAAGSVRLPGSRDRPPRPTVGPARTPSVGSGPGRPAGTPPPWGAIRLASAACVQAYRPGPVLRPARDPSHSPRRTPFHRACCRRSPPRSWRKTEKSRGEGSGISYNKGVRGLITTLTTP
jgi:hypothetical protein